MSRGNHLEGARRHFELKISGLVHTAMNWRFTISNDNLSTSGVALHFSCNFE